MHNILFEKLVLLFAGHTEELISARLRQKHSSCSVLKSLRAVFAAMLAFAFSNGTMVSVHPTGARGRDVCEARRAGPRVHPADPIVTACTIRAPSAAGANNLADTDNVPVDADGHV